MLQTISDNIVNILCTVILTGAIGVVTHLFRQFKGLNEAVLAINHDRLYQACTFFILTGQITVDELKNLEYLYKGYHALGGNGTGTELYEKCKDLPIVEKRTVWHESYTQSC